MERYQSPRIGARGSLKKKVPKSIQTTIMQLRSWSLLLLPQRKNHPQRVESLNLRERWWESLRKRVGGRMWGYE